MYYTLTDIYKLKAGIDCKICQLGEDFFNTLKFDVKCGENAKETLRSLIFFTDQLQNIIDYNTQNTLYNPLIILNSGQVIQNSITYNYYTFISEQLNGWFKYRTWYYTTANPPVYDHSSDNWDEFIVYIPCNSCINLDNIASYINNC